MNDFNFTQLRRLDLTVLLVFEEAMISGKLSSAARRFGLTPSAVSHALKRLRQVFDDELFVRTASGVQPTPRARALRGPLSEAIRLLTAATQPATFDPLKDDRAFRIGSSDYEAALLAPALLADGAAPRFLFRTLVRREALEALRADELDLVLGYTWQRGSALDAEILFEEDYLVVGRRGHPALSRRLTARGYASLDHVLVAPGGSMSGIVDTTLAAAGLSRRVALAVPYFLAALAAVSRTNLVATVPRRLARRHAGDFRLTAVAAPLPIRKFPVHMVWSKRSGKDPANAWLRDRVRQACDGSASRR